MKYAQYVIRVNAGRYKDRKAANLGLGRIEDLTLDKKKSAKKLLDEKFGKEIKLFQPKSGAYRLYGHGGLDLDEFRYNLEHNYYKGPIGAIAAANRAKKMSTSDKLEAAALINKKYNTSYNNNHRKTDKVFHHKALQKKCVERQLLSRGITVSLALFCVRPSRARMSTLLQEAASWGFSAQEVEDLLMEVAVSLGEVAPPGVTLEESPQR